MAVEVFFSYSHRDDDLRQSLLTHLALLKREGLILPWHDRQIDAGDDWEGEIDGHLETAQIVLLLVSPDFIASDYSYDREMKRALERHERGECRVIPIILRPVDWRTAPFSKLQALPRDGKPVTSWTNKDEAFVDVARGIRAVISGLPAPAPEDPADDGVNPFGQIMAIREPSLFVGRESELRVLRALLTRGSVAIVGPSKVGKSSLLWQLVRSWDGAGEVLGPIDLQALEDVDDFYGELAELLGLETGKWRPLRAELRTRDVVLLLDELDSGPGRSLDSDHLGRFRALCNQNPAFRMVAVSRGAVKISFPDDDVGSAAYSFLQPMLLSDLSDHDARRLLEHPWMPEARRFDAAAVEEIVALAGKHPFKLQRAAYHRYAALREAGYDWRTAWKRDMEHML
jgi:hypothetical protein